jgi:hypothetical protein
VRAIEDVAQSLDRIIAEFELRYRQQYGFLMPGKPLIVEAIGVEAVGRTHEAADIVRKFAGRDGPPVPVKRNRIYTEGTFRDAAVYDRGDLRPGDTITGPSVIREDTATTVIEPGWCATFTIRGDLVLERVEAAQRVHAVGTSADPVLLEVFNNLFMAIAEQMGVTLANTAYSVNIKERLDFSCALFDAEGNLIANAPHMPVHLGSMGESVKTIIERRTGSMGDGDVFVLNAPYNGGTHLPDVTVIAPVFLARSVASAPAVGAPQPEFFVASRGHHADIGGTTPGSMPPDSTHVDEEGVLIDNVQLVAGGRFLEAEMRALLGGGRYPSRNVDQNLADLRAQVAACAKGAEELAKMVALCRCMRAYEHAEQRRGVGASRAGRAEGRHLRVRDGRRGGHPRRDPRRPGEARGGDRLHRHEPAASDQFQRALGRVQGGRALRVPHARGRRDPDERRVPQAAHDRDPRGVDARTAHPAAGRQCRDVAGDHRLPVRGARRARRLAGHDEQLHVRQRAPPVLRDDLGRIRRGTGLRRHQCRADAHDQLAAHRSGSARVALPGAPRVLRHTARQRRRGREPRR